MQTDRDEGRAGFHGSRVARLTKEEFETYWLEHVGVEKGWLERFQLEIQACDCGESYCHGWIVGLKGD